MNARTCVFLVLLQLAIGWHLLYEGLWKGQGKAKGETWSSKGYLQNAAGPAGPAIRYLAGDPDVTWQESQFVVTDPVPDFVARFTVVPLDPKEAPETRRLHKHMPPALAREWQDYFDRFAKHYELDHSEKPRPEDQAGRVPPEFLTVLIADPLAGTPAGFPWSGMAFSYYVAKLTDASEPRSQYGRAHRILIEQENDTVKWLLGEPRKNMKPSLLSGPAAAIPRSIPERLQEYQAKVEEVRRLKAGDVAIFGPKLTPKLRQATDEQKAMEKELTDDLNDRTTQMRKALRTVLTWDQKRMDLPRQPAPPERTWSRFGIADTVSVIDKAVRWTLLATGICLLLGFLTRTACLVGALLLLMFYLAMPPWPGVPGNPQADGHFLFINNNIIEILALLTIAVSQPYRRYGLDFWLHLLLFGRRPAQVSAPAGPPPVRPPVRPAPALGTTNGGVTASISPHPSTEKDATHVS